MITLVHILNILSESDEPLSEFIKPLRRYADSGEINFEVEDKIGAMEQLKRKYSQGQIDDLDGVTIQFSQWWFNCRASNTEPLLRLNVEAQDEELLQAKLDDLKAFLGEPVDY